VKKTFRKFAGLKAASRAAASFAAKLASVEIRKKGYFTIAVSGGNDPVPFYRLLAKSGIDWKKTLIFWQDDRFVDYTHRHSNVRLVFDNLIRKAKVPLDRVFPAPAPSHIKDPKKAAIAYELIISRLLGGGKNRMPSFDLIIAGVGPDGHTASLFPKDKKALNEKKRLVIAVKAPSYAVVKDRITMTLPLINSAKNVLFIVSGKGKSEAMRAIMKGDKRYPAAKVRARNELVWMIDKEVI